MPHYAQIDAAQRVFAVTETSGPIEAADMIPVDCLDVELLNKFYDAATGKFWDPEG